MRNLAYGLRELGHEVTVITHDMLPEELSGVEIVKVPLPAESGLLRRKLDRWRWEPHHTWSLRAWRCFDGMRNRDSFDIIETAEYGSWARHFIGKVDVPLVVRCHTPAHGVREIAPGERIKRVPLWLKHEDAREKWQTIRADAISAPSYALSNHISLSWSIASSRMMILPNPVDTEMFHSNGDLASRKKELLFVGRLQYNKGVFDLAEAIKPILREHPDLKVRLVGSDLPVPRHLPHSCRMASEEILANIPNENHHQVVISGHMPLLELIECEHKAMCAVVPSRGFESFSYTMAQHMACGTAVVASHCGGPTEIISHGSDGLLVPPGDRPALTTALRQLIANPALCAELGQRASRKVAGQFSIRVVVPRIARWYEQVISQYRGQRSYAGSQLCNQDI